jgi:hypothetical protein
MSRLSPLDAAETNPSNDGLAVLMGRWLDALARKDAIPAKDREGRIDADTVAFDIEREIVGALEGRTPAVIFHRNEWYVLSRSILLKAEFINLEESS